MASDPVCMVCRKVAHEFNECDVCDRAACTTCDVFMKRDEEAMNDGACSACWPLVRALRTTRERELRAQDGGKAEEACNKEVERKFLVAPGFDRERELGQADRVCALEQYYVMGGKGREMRVRRSATSVADSRGRLLRRAAPDFTLTVKAKVDGSGGLVRTEVEAPITEMQFLALRAVSLADGAMGRGIVKTRHVYDTDQGVVELDVYEVPALRNQVAEIEFKNEAAARAWEPPAWMVSEVTGKKERSNAELAKAGAKAGACE